MYLIACGVVLGFVDHAGVYILKVCPWCSLDLQDKIKQLPLLSLLAGNVFYFTSLGQQFGAVSAWEMSGIFVALIITPILLYTAFQKHKAADADGYLSMSDDNVPTPTNKKHAFQSLHEANSSGIARWRSLSLKRQRQRQRQPQGQ